MRRRTNLLVVGGSLFVLVVALLYWFSVADSSQGSGPSRASASEQGALFKSHDEDSAQASHLPAKSQRVIPPKNFLNRGLQAVRDGNSERAEREHRDGIAADQDTGRQHRFLSALLMEKGDWNGAVSHWQQAIDLGEDDAGTHANLARALSKLGDHEEAVHEATIAVEMDPESLSMRRVLVEALSEQGKPREVMEAVDSAAQTAGVSSLLYRKAAEAAISLGEAERAAKYSLQAIANEERETLFEAPKAVQGSQAEPKGHNKAR